MTLIPATKLGATATWCARCDSRWTMAFSAVAGDRTPAAFDTTSPDGCAVHPMFSVAAEWALLTARPDPFGLGLSPHDEVAGIHVSHDLRVHHSWRSPDEVSVDGEVVGLRQVRSGVMVSFRFAAHQQSTGQPLWTTTKGMIYLGASLEGTVERADDGYLRPSGQPVGASCELTWAADAGFAHIYTECARIWNPLHTDVGAARGAGLEQPILHGTATMVRSVTEITDRLGLDISQVRGLGGEFRAMVPLPSFLRVRVTQVAAHSGSLVHFDAINDAGGEAIRHGYIELA